MQIGKACDILTPKGIAYYPIPRHHVQSLLTKKRKLLICGSLMEAHSHTFPTLRPFRYTCLSAITPPRQEGTVQAAGLEVHDTRKCDRRCSITKTTALTSMCQQRSSPSSRLSLPCRGLTDTTRKRRCCLDKDWQIALGRLDLREHRLWNHYQYPETCCGLLGKRTHSKGHSSIRESGKRRRPIMFQGYWNRPC
jgi:hypothetical protein